MSNRPRLIWEPGAVNDLARLREFIEPHNPKAAFHAARRIVEFTNLLLDNPRLGHPLKDMPEFYQLFIPFGKRGYVLKYRIENSKIIILRVWHVLENR